MSLFVLAGEQHRTGNDAAKKNGDEGQTDEIAWRVGIYSPELLIQESLVVPIHRITRYNWCLSEVQPMSLKTGE